MRRSGVRVLLWLGAFDSLSLRLKDGSGERVSSTGRYFVKNVAKGVLYFFFPFAAGLVESSLLN